VIQLYDTLDLARTLGYNFLFRGVPQQHMRALACTAEIRIFSGGDVIVRQFERGDDLYIILTGEASIKSFQGDEMATFGPGSVIGEMALVDEAPRSATVIARGTTEVAVISGNVVRGLLLDPEIRATVMTNLSRLLSRRLRSMNSRECPVAIAR